MSKHFGFPYIDEWTAQVRCHGFRRGVSLFAASLLLRALQDKRICRKMGLLKPVRISAETFYDKSLRIREADEEKDRIKVKTEEEQWDLYMSLLKNRGERCRRRCEEANRKYEQMKRRQLKNEEDD